MTFIVTIAILAVGAWVLSLSKLISEGLVS